MKQLYFFSAGLLFISLVLLQPGGAFAQQNAFLAKKKCNQSTQIKQPGKLKPVLSGESIVTGNGSFPNTSIHYKPIPFAGLKSIDRKEYSSLQFAANNQLIFAECKPGNEVPFDSKTPESVSTACYSYLNRLSGAMNIDKPGDEFEVMQAWDDELGFTNIRMQQYFKGIPVYGGQLMLHGTHGMLNRFNGTYFPTPYLPNLIPDISPGQAVNNVIQDVSLISPMRELTANEKMILKYDEPIAELIIYHNRLEVNAEKLAWHITIRPDFMKRWEYFIDAGTGEIINKFDNTCSDGPSTAQAPDLNGISRTINTYLSAGKYYLIDASRPMFNPGQSQFPDNPVGAIWTIDANNTNSQDLSLSHITSINNQWNNPTAVSAHFNAGVTYEYYRTTHGRNSINNQGGTIISIINVADDDGGGLDNAYWNGEAMFYGGGSQIFLPLAGGLDVGAHEMTHGVVQNTANLEYQYESGAINEAMADIGGTMVDRLDWQLGEDVIPSNSPYYPNGALRDMANPHNGGSSFNDQSYQPMHVNEMYTGSQDNGGVHKNSGIINHAYYLLAESISKDKAEKLFYRALSDYMTKSSQFIDCRLAFEQAAKDIYGAGSAEFTAVVNSFYQVGIGANSGGGNGSAPPGELPVNPGQDYILSYDVNSADPNNIYVSNTQGSGFVPISQTEIKGKPSLIDDGSVGVFISNASVMKSILLQSPYTESELSGEYIWDNVAVSKDGMRIAAITTEVDSAIWIYDFGIAQWSKYHLYNPTFTPGIVTDNVLYADQLEWDYSGEYLIYDAYNELKNSNGENIDYWDMSLIRVWDKAANTWGDGQIAKVFSSLPDGISVGNPCFAKNSPYVIAFDYIDNNSGEMNVLAANLETGDIGSVYEGNKVLGFPNYSKLDDKIVFSAKNTNGDEVVAQVPLNPNKIESNGDATVLINDAKWPVWYSTGLRDLSDVEQMVAESIFTNVYPNPFSDEVTVVINGSRNTTYRVELYDMYGQLVGHASGISAETLTKTTFPLGNLGKGTYIVKIIAGNKVSSLKIVKT
jgi:bacillolysin